MGDAGLFAQTRISVSHLVITKGANVPKSTACRRCGDERHYTGTRWRCSRCFNKWQKSRRENLSPEKRTAERARANANRLLERAAWSDEKRALENARTQEWRTANRAQHRSVTHEWYRRNADHARAAKLAEYYQNPETFYARNLVRKARVAEAVCVHGPKCVSAEFLKTIWESVCLYCGDPAEHADHFYPLARGGLHCIENLVPACQPCNNSKCASDPYEWWSSKVE